MTTRSKRPARRQASRPTSRDTALVLALGELLERRFRTHEKSERGDRQKLLEMHAQGLTNGLELAIKKMEEKFDRMSLVFDGMASAYERERAAAERLLRKVEEHEVRIAVLEEKVREPAPVPGAITVPRAATL